MAGELSGRRKFTESMSDHVLGHEDRHEELAVMNMERESHEFRRNHRSSRPGLDHTLAATGGELVDLALEAGIDVGAFAK